MAPTPSTADPTPLLARNSHPPHDPEPQPPPSHHAVPIPPAPASATPLSSIPYPGETSGFYSLLLFTWVQPILDRGRVGPLTPSDMFLAPHHLLSSTYTRELQAAYAHYQQQPKRPSNLLLRAIIRAFRRRYFFRLWAMRSVLLTLTIIRPFILRELLLFISAAFVASREDWDAGDQLTVGAFHFASWAQVSEGVYWAVTLSLITLIMAFLNHHFWWIGVQLALTVRGACIGMLYSKSASMHWTHRAEYSSGRISNLASVDGDNLMNFMVRQRSAGTLRAPGHPACTHCVFYVLCCRCAGSVHELIAAPILIVLCVAALLWVLGIAALVGVATLIVSLCFTSYLARRQSYLQDLIMNISDRRVSQVSELLTSIKLIKLYSWQFPFSERVRDIRLQQETALYKSTAIGAITRCLGLASPLFVSFASFAVFSALGHTLDATTAFTALLLFNQLKEPMGKLPECVTSYVKMWISQQRIAVFLNCRDAERYVEHVDSDGRGVVAIEGGEFDWCGDAELHTADSNTAEERVPLSPVEAQSPPPTHAPALNSSTLPTTSLLPGLVHRSHSHAGDDAYQRMDDHSDAKALELSAVSTAATHSTPPSTPPILSDLNLSVPSGSLVMIVGSVGAGKSSLLQALLGEMHRRRGRVRISRRIAYTSQVAFLQSASIRANILFGLPLDESRYQRTLHACALLEDLSRLPAADGTLVGENGLTLSGGQKMRVILARAVYSDADVFLCDEPLGAVDAHVGLHLFDHVFGPSGILAKKTVLLVTHQLQFAPRCDLLVLMQQGRIAEKGSYEELRAKGFDFRAIVSEAHTGAVNGSAEAVEDEEKDANHLDEPPRSPPQLSQPNTPKLNGSLTPRSPRAISSTAAPHASSAQATSIVIAQSSLMQNEDITEESLNVGRMGWKVYKEYFGSGAGLLGWIVVISLVIASQVAVVSSDYVLAWASTAGVERESDPDSSLPSQSQYLLWYLYLVLASTVLLAARSLYLAFICTKAGAVLHHRLFFGLLRAPQYFHETTPSGRVLNRVGKDVDMVDSQLPGVIQNIFACSVSVAGTVALTVLVTPLSVPALALILVLYLLIQRSYRPSSVAMKRLESVTRSPIYQHFGETANGLSTIRSYRHTGAVQRAILECFHRVDLNTRIYFFSFSVHRWMGLRLETLGALTVLFSSLIALFLLPSLSPGLVGLVITTSLGLSGQLHWLVRQRTEMEVQLNAVERIVEYATLPPEESDERWDLGWRAEKAHNRALASAHSGQLQAPAPSPPHDTDPHSQATLIPPPDWPAQGEIRFHHLTAAYRPPPHDISVLHDVSAVIAPGEKVGIVGRTGAGKSTLSLALFRLMEAKRGYITIDGLPIHRIPLHLLRSKLMIIPQESVLFSHSLRYNLDPFNRSTDTELWAVLQRIGLRALVEGWPDRLQHQVADSGENLSMGERQLLCLGRALLRPSKVLVMDEASASLDLECDQLMKAVIASSFAACTTLTIAHRLNTVLGSDRIAVFEAGRLKEFDAPATLLARGGLLKQLMEDAQSMTKEMRAGERDGGGGKPASQEHKVREEEDEDRTKAGHDEQRVRPVS